MSEVPLCVCSKVDGSEPHTQRVNLGSDLVPIHNSAAQRSRRNLVHRLGFQLSVRGTWVWDLGFLVLSLGVWVVGCGIWVQELVGRVNGRGLRISEFGFSVADYGFQVSGWEFRVEG